MIILTPFSPIVPANFWPNPAKWLRSELTLWHKRNGETQPLRKPPLHRTQTAPYPPRFPVSSKKTLPYHLRRQYSDDALPYLRKALRESPSAALRLECARELALEGEKEAFKYFGEQFEADEQGRYKIVSFVLDHFELPGDRTEEAVLEYVKARSK